MRNITGIFDSKFEADRATLQLLNEGFSNSDLSLIMSDATRDIFLYNGEDAASKVAKGGAAGAAIGGALGALLAGLTAVGSIVITGGSGILIAGPLVAILSGLGAGGIVGGFSGALIQAGFAADEAANYEDEIRAGKAILVVHTHSDAEEAKARSALSSYGATYKAA